MSYTATPIENIETVEQARNEAMVWQHEFSNTSLSYGELVEYQVYFEKLAKKFNLTGEFKENGII